MFQKATKKQAKGRFALDGPSGAGKTYTGLMLACALGNNPAVIDTERRSASKYSDMFSFDVAELTDFHPRKYIDAIKAASAAGYDSLLIDSLSHAWSGKGGALEIVDDAKARHKGSSFHAWREVTPLHNELIDAILSCPMHVVVTMRTKTEYSIDRDKNGRTSISKVGTAPIQRDGMEYEFDVVGDMDLENRLIISKTRCSALNQKTFKKPGKEFAQILVDWLSDGESAEQRLAGVCKGREVEVTKYLQSVGWITEDISELSQEMVDRILGNTTGFLEQVTKFAAEKPKEEAAEA